MISYLLQLYSGTLAAFRSFGHRRYRAFGLLSSAFPPFIRPSEPDDNDFSNDGAELGCNAYTVPLLPRRELEVIGFGASAQVYRVDDDIVLKTSWVFERPGSSASDNDRWHYVSDVLCQSNLLKNERAVLRILQRHPHSHIMGSIDLDQSEGIYLRRYRSLPSHINLSDSDRVWWYLDLPMHFVIFIALA